MQPNDDQGLLTTKDVASMLNVSVGTVLNLAYSGALRSFRIRRARRYAHKDVEAYLDASRSQCSGNPSNEATT